jgi:hypothetical protein
MAVPENWDSIQDGMTLRDWFAGQALVAIINDRQGSTVRDMADRAYIYADIMLEARGDCE